MKNPTHADVRLCLIIEEKLVPRFFLLLGQGFSVKISVGCSIKEMFCGQLGFHDDYLEKRIQTIFLDGKAVDDVESSFITDGSTIALSAAMPGLVGAILRKGGRYATMRSQISHSKDGYSALNRKGKVNLKLFNLIAKEVGPTFLKQGIWIKGDEFFDFVNRQQGDFWVGCKAAELDGKNLDPAKIKEIEWKNKNIFLQLKMS